MALPTIATVNAAATSIFTAISAGGAKAANNRAAVQAMNEVFPVLARCYTPVVDFVITDSQDADEAALFAGQLLDALVAANKGLEVGTVFQVGGAGDTTDNALATEKGDLVVDGDLFEVINVDTPEVEYLGTAGDLDFSALSDTVYVDVL